MGTKLIPVTLTTVLLLSFAVLNVDGQPLQLVVFPLQSRNPNFPSFGEFQLVERQLNTGNGMANWLHGWPCAGLLRSGNYPVGRKGEATKTSFTGPFGVYSRWPFDDAPWDHLSVSALVIDALLAIAVTCETYLWLTAAAANRYRFSISSLLIAAIVAAVLVTYRWFFLDVHDHFETAALLVACSCILFTTIRSVFRLTHVRSMFQNNALRLSSRKVDLR